MEAPAAQDYVGSVLSEFGLTSVEISVYKAALALGSRPASTIAQKAGLKRGHTYNVLESLIEKGLVQEFVKSSIRHFVASQPKSLVGVLERKEHELAAQKQRLLQALPHLEQLKNPLSAEPKVRFFKGLDGIKEVFNDMTSVPNQTIYGIVDLERSWSVVDDATQCWINGYIKRREEKNIFWNGIVVKSPIADRSLRIRPSDRRQLKMVQGVELPAEVHVYGSKVAIMSTYLEMIGVIIESEPIAFTLRTFMTLLWESLPPYALEGDAQLNEEAA